MSSQSNGLYQQMESASECTEKSQSGPVVVFKHSAICPTSSYAKREMDAFIQLNSLTAYLVVVQDQRPLSNELAEHLGVEHASPQALCLKNGNVIATFSHYDITQDNLAKAFSDESL
ncbi:MAG: bacillithiol system redox-active protein YtxJ [Candidatus Hinthialibacter antarcticus]|nr:bacillithiol system redox-active protein YtxJ [Candidatus Hinthialibacter antarcticus]